MFCYNHISMLFWLKCVYFSVIMCMTEFAVSFLQNRVSNVKKKCFSMNLKLFYILMKVKTFLVSAAVHQQFDNGQVWKLLVKLIKASSRLTCLFLSPVCLGWNVIVWQFGAKHAHWSLKLVITLIHYHFQNTSNNLSYNPHMTQTPLTIYT